MFQFDHSDEKQELYVDEMAKAYMLEAGRWAKFIAIFGFIVFGLMVLAGLYFLSSNNNIVSVAMQASGMSPQATGILYIVLAIVYLFPLLALFNFSRWIKRAIKGEDSGQLNNAFRYLKNHFKYIGIILILVISLYALLFLFLLVVGGVAAVAS